MIAEVAAVEPNMAWVAAAIATCAVVFGAGWKLAVQSSAGASRADLDAFKKTQDERHEKVVELVQGVKDTCTSVQMTVALIGRDVETVSKGLDQVHKDSERLVDEMRTRADGQHNRLRRDVERIDDTVHDHSQTLTAVKLRFGIETDRDRVRTEEMELGEGGIG